jgi:two-component system, cell cycle response regulator DivK
VSATILVVEDNPDNMRLFAWTLADEGYAFEGAGSAEEGLAALELRPFDLVLMDIVLPGIDGNEATRRIRAQPRFAHLPIIAVTAIASSGDVESILAAGATMVVPRPVDEKRLIDAIRSGLRGEPSRG